MIGFRHAFKGKSISARRAVPIVGMYTFVNCSNASVQIVVEITKLLSISKPSLMRVDFDLVLLVPRESSRVASFIIMAP